MNLRRVEGNFKVLKCKGCKFYHLCKSLHVYLCAKNKAL